MQSSAMTVEEDDEAIKKTAATNPRSRSKKKSTLTKLKEKKQKELGSSASLRQERDSLLISEASKHLHEKPRKTPGVGSEGETVLHERDGGNVSTKDHLQDLRHSGRPRPLPRGRRQSLDVTAESVNDNTQMIDEPAKGDGNSKREIADNATVKVVRNINTNSEQLDSAGPTVGQSSFVPRPPSTPRTPRLTPRIPRGLFLAGKGEKRIREPGSSGDEVEQKKEKINRINQVIKARETENEEFKHLVDVLNISDTINVRREKSASLQGSEQSINTARSRRRSSNARIDCHSQEIKNNDIDKPPIDHTSTHAAGSNTNSNNDKKTPKASPANIDEFIIQETIQNIPHESGNSPRGNYSVGSLIKKSTTSASDSGMSVVLNNAHPRSSHVSAAAGGSDKSSSTQDKADDALLMLNDLLLTDSGTPLTRPVNTTESPVKEHSVSSPPRVPRLDPISPRSYPPPLPEELSSKSLRTMYKIDPDVHPRTMMGHSGSGSSKTDSGTNSNGDQLSQKSFHSVSVLPVITTKEARSRNAYEGSIMSSNLGTYELDRYFPERKVNVFVGTWNMNELKDVRWSIDDFILPERCDYVQDIYAIGTQENNMTKKEWEITVQETIGPSHVLFHSVSLGSLHLAVYIRRDLIWFCSVPEDDAISLRAVTMVKTKGAIGICFTLFGTSYLFINCHLTSDRDNETSRKKNRLGDYCKVISEMKLPKSSGNSAPSGKPADVTSVFDCIFWFGDLNFRIERKRHAVEGKVNQITSEEFPNFETLLGGDQLLNYMAEGKIFGGFQEGRINFHPTFKFDINSDAYDSSAKNRVPSYTDRIMFRSKKKHDITCLNYDAVMTIKWSDHRPVYGQFETVIKPGRDNMMYAVGHFDKAVYMEAIQRRTATLPTKKKQSVVCTIQ